MGWLGSADGRRGPRRRVAWTACVVAGAGVTGAAMLAVAGPAVAQPTPACGAPVVSGGTATVTCAETGAAQYWTVPAGITHATFTLYGSNGGPGSALDAAGGRGAEVIGTLPVTPGAVLQVNVGHAGSLNSGTTFGGGGGAGADGAGGGGASDIRSAAADGSYPLANRLLVAGGGGGGGIGGSGTGSDSGGAGGNAGSAGQTAATDTSDIPEIALGGGVGGGAGTSTAGGGGGAGGTASPNSGTCAPFNTGDQGNAGGLGTGGHGGQDVGGGGGGGGYYGGGGGGTGSSGNSDTDECDNEAGGGGGGGGSSFLGSATGTTLDNGVSAPGAGGNGEVIITYQVLAITTTSLPGGVVGNAYSQTLAATGGTTPYTWSVSSGSLPTGLSINSATGVISGTPTNTGTFSFTVKVTDSGSPALTATKALSIAVIAPLSVTTTSLPGGQVGTAYTATLAATGGVAAYTWSVAAGLPPGLSVNASTGVISGTPTAYGTYTFTVVVTDADGATATARLSITVKPAPLVITTSSLPAATGGAAYTATLAATGGVTPYAWSVTAGSLPPGLSLNASTGVISGTPDVAGTYTFTVTVTDAESPAMTAGATFSISVSGPVITSVSPASGPVYGDTPVIITGTGLSCPAGAAGCHVSVTFGGKPAIVAFTRSGEIGVISPANGATGTVTVTVTVNGVSSQATAASRFTYGSPFL